MKNLFNPRWILLLNTAPVIILLWIFFYNYQVIQSMIEPEVIVYWKIFGFTLVGLTVVNLVVSALLVWKKKQVPGYLAAIMLVAYIAWLYLYLYNLGRMVPFNVPQWMFSGNIFIYASTFLMPTLFYYLLVLVGTFTRSPEKNTAWVNFGIAVSVPVLVYLFFVGVLPELYGGRSRSVEQLFVIILIICTLLFLFFLMRTIYILATKNNPAWRKYELCWKIPIAIIFPILGLLFNNGLLFDELIGSTSGVFGDFNNRWFYLLAAINGLLVCLPERPEKIYRLVLYLLRCTTFSFICYFFLVFLPFLPLSILAIIAVGLGFLMLTPLVLFLIQTGVISNDYRYLRRYHSTDVLVAAGVACFLIIPAVITVSYVKDRQTLHQALDYVYEPDYSKTYRINERRLISTLFTVVTQKNSSDFLFVDGYKPYLSSWYNWIVLDNLTLSDKKIETLKYLFTGDEPGYYAGESDDEYLGDPQVDITASYVNTRFDTEQKVWISELNLEITNFNELDQKEYATVFELPDGCWISDYYLYVGDRKEPGILSEKRSAMWVYSQIKDENKDPGILHYRTGNRIVFKIFPFMGSEVRKTGIEFIHKEPFALTVDGRQHQMGDEESITHPAGGITLGPVHYIPSAQKENLRSAWREPYFHFIIDNSLSAADKKEKLIYFTEKLMGEHPALAEHARFSITNGYLKTFGPGPEWKQYYWGTPAQGGFFVDRSIKTALVETFNSHRYPIIVVVTDNLYPNYLDKDYADYRYLLPETDSFYTINDVGILTTHSLHDRPHIGRRDSAANFDPQYRVLKYTGEDGMVGFVRDDGQPSLVLKEPIFKLTKDEINTKSWQTGLLMQAHWMSQIIHPETSGQGWKRLADASFKSRIMTPVTSYIAVENEAQRAALERKQKQVMSADKSLDTADQPRRMSEPGFYALAIFTLLLLWVERKRRARIS